MTHIDKKYHNIVINEQNNTFYIEELESKGDLHALSTLEKIRQIRDNEMEYKPPDFFSQETSGPIPKLLDPSRFQDGDLQPLKEIAENVCKGYKDKIDKLGWFKKYFRGNHLKKNIDITFKSIFSPSHLFSLSDKVIIKLSPEEDQFVVEQTPVFVPALAIHKIFSFLPLSDVAKFSSLNREGEKRVKSEILIRAEKFGYVGKDETEAEKYLKELCKEVKSVFEFFIWDSRKTTEEFFSFNDDEGFFSHPTVKAEETLEKLMQLSPENLIKILENRVYVEKYKILRQFLGSGAYLKAQPENRNASLHINFYATNFGKIALEQAIISKDVGIVRLLLENGADPNAITISETTPAEIQKLILARREKVELVNKLLGAIENKNLEEVKRLLELGADPNGKGALHKAVKSGSTEIVELLLQKGAPIDRIYEGTTPLGYACGNEDRKPNIEMVKFLLAKKANPNIGFLLHYAASYKNVEVVKLLLEYKVNVNMLDSGNCNALHYACGENYTNNYQPNAEIVKLLLEAGLQSNINDKEYNRMTPLSLACRGNPDPEVIKLLLENDADPNTYYHDYYDDYNTPIKNIIKNFGSPEVIKLLIDKRAYLTEKSYQQRAFSLACGYKNNTPNVGLVNYFLKEGLNPNFDVHNDGNTPLHVAVQNNAIEIIKVLLDHKNVKINKRNEESHSPLYLACFNGNPDIIKILIEKGAKLDVLLFLRAVQSGSVESVKLLLEKDKQLIKKIPGSHPATYCLLFSTKKL